MSIRGQVRTLAHDAAVSELYRLHWAGLVRLAVLVVDDRQAAEDAVQESFAQLYRHWPLRDNAKALGWLRTTVVNRCRSVLRRRRAARLYTPPHEEPHASAESAALIGEERAQVQRALQALPTRTREVLVLRYYLDLPFADIAQTLGIGESTARSTSSRGMMLAAAGIAAILVLAASFLTRQPDTQVAPAGPVSGAAPRVPYTVSQGRGVTLHDGARQVRVPSTFLFDGFFRGRVGGGWLTLETPRNRPMQVGLLLPDGSFRPLGPAGGQGPVPSPDGSQVALVAPRPDQKGRVLVIDVRSGREVATTPVQARVPLMLGWNKDGVWMSHDEAKTPELLVWQPGSGQPRAVAVPGFDGARAIPGTAGNIVLSTRSGNNRCLKAGVANGATFEVQREYCDQGVEQLYPVLSPDGRTMIQSQQKLAIDLATGKVTKLQLPDRVLDWPEPVFEDATQVLALTEPADVMGEIPRELYRCDVTTGACKLLVKKAADIALQMP